jgi:hypothetical protein
MKKVRMPIKRLFQRKKDANKKNKVAEITHVSSNLSRHIGKDYMYVMLHKTKDHVKIAAHINSFFATKVQNFFS